MTPINVMRRNFYNIIIRDSNLIELKRDKFKLDLSYDRKTLKAIITKYGGTKKSLHFNWNPLSLNDSRWKEYNKDVIAGVKDTINAAKYARINELEASLKTKLSLEQLEMYNSMPPLSAKPGLINDNSFDTATNITIVGGRTRRQKRAKAVTRRKV